MPPPPNEDVPPPPPDQPPAPPPDLVVGVTSESVSDEGTVAVQVGNTMYGEGSDRADLRLAPGQDRLIAALCRTNVRVVVVLTTPDAVELPWLDDVAGLIISFFPGQGYGRALADTTDQQVTIYNLYKFR